MVAIEIFDIWQCTLDNSWKSCNCRIALPEQRDLNIASIVSEPIYLKHVLRKLS